MYVLWKSIRVTKRTAVSHLVKPMKCTFWHRKYFAVNPAVADALTDVMRQWTSGISGFVYCDTHIDLVNAFRPRQNGRHFADDIFKCIFLNENIWISIQISPKFVPKGPINNIPALVQIMAWCRLGDKPLSELMMVSLLTYTCVTRPQWVKYPFMKCWLWHLWAMQLLSSNIVHMYIHIIWGLISELCNIVLWAILLLWRIYHTGEISYVVSYIYISQCHLVYMVRNTALADALSLSDAGHPESQGWYITIYPHVYVKPSLTPKWWNGICGALWHMPPANGVC